MNRNESSHDIRAGGMLPRLLLLLLLLPSLPVSAALKAWLDRDRVASGESVRLTLERDGRAGDQPDLTPLQQDFEEIGRASCRERV